MIYSGVNKDVVMSTVTTPTPEQLPRILEFLNAQLRPNAQWSIFDEYPLAFAQKNLENLRIVEVEGRIVAHALVKYLLVRSPAGLFKVAAIGSVEIGRAHV